MDKKKILVVDDEPDFLELIKMRLEANNFEVITASSGQKALEEIKNKSINAVLLDILMPGIDGIEVLKKIREENKDIPVFMITAFSNEERFKMANSLDASGFIVKTSDLKEEVERITSILRMSDRYKRNT